tara:strand:+ start:119 stop:406 length:288 start_codon:yes stop_codon:yes gene_type:complete
MDPLTEPNPSVEPTIYSPTDISLLIGGIAAAFATIVYSCKHIKKSKCCGFSCEQVVVDDPCDEPHELNLVVDENSSDKLTQLDLLKHNIVKHSEL